MTAKDIQRAIIDKYNSEIVLPNYFYGSWECDVFHLNSNGFVIEYEIKVSRSDFLNDFTKQRYGLNKHSELANGNTELCNKFYFVVPTGLIESNEVPNHCGLIYFDGENLKVVKKAKFLHKVEINPNYFKKLAYKLYYRLASAKLNYPK